MLMRSSRTTIYLVAETIASDGWKSVRRTIIGTMKDVAVPREVQEQMWHEFKDEIKWIETRHSPFPAKPEYIADVILGSIE